MEQVEPITDYLKRRLRELGASRFDALAEKTGVTGSFIRKFVYGSRENPRVQTIQPLVDYFAAVDREEESIASLRVGPAEQPPAATAEQDSDLAHGVAAGEKRTELERQQTSNRSSERRGPASGDRPANRKGR